MIFSLVRVASVGKFVLRRGTIYAGFRLYVYGDVMWEKTYELATGKRFA